MTRTPPREDADDREHHGQTPGSPDTVDIDCIPSSALPFALAAALHRGRPATYRTIRRELFRRVARMADGRMIGCSPADPTDPLMPINDGG